MNTSANSLIQSELKLKMNTLDIYNNGGLYISQNRLFHAYYNEIPNMIEISNLALEKVKQWVEEEYKNEIVLQHFKNEYCHTVKKSILEDHFFFLKNGIMINLYCGSVYVLFIPIEEQRALQIQNKCLQFVVKQKVNKEISFIVSDRTGGLTTKKIEIKKPRIDFETNYNDGFKEIHKTIVKNIRQNGKKGLYLFHGQPGTGKSTYIKYLIQCQNKQVIFLSPKMAGNLDDIHFTNFLLDNPNCILVIEDAEEIILTRDNNQNTRLSFLLNLTDGLLSEGLGIQIIATFNTDLINIDKALLRKGRLTTIYEFKPLELNKTNHLIRKIGHNFEVKNKMTLADIYNIEKENHYTPNLRKAVGFGV
jgi:hypothetical protein